MLKAIQDFYKDRILDFPSLWKVPDTFSFGQSESIAG